MADKDKKETTETDKTETTEGGSAEGTVKKEVRKRVKDIDFMRAWQTSDSVAEVVTATGITTAGQRAMKLRKRGYKLKHMPKGSGVRLTEESEAALLVEFNALNAELTKDEKKAETPAS